MAPQFSGRVALVTGAGSGIGRASALAFARHGAKVVVADVAAEAGEETAALARAENADAIFVRVDVSQRADVEALVRAAVDQYGRLDYAHNNAGIPGPQALLADYDEEAWDKVIAINLKGIWLCMKHEIQQMLRQGGRAMALRADARGVIINTASVAGLRGSQGVSAYVASKHAVVGLTRAAALEYAREGIRVNSVAPGTIHTPMLDRFTAGDELMLEQFAKSEPMGRLGTPEEVAQAVLWLCSDDSSFVTGATLAVDGGRLA
jgi:NAD(P)-dependent dehydrogenase (short-subunit alcohol dehydrogenase family)